MRNPAEQGGKNILEQTSGPSSNAIQISETVKAEYLYHGIAIVPVMLLDLLGSTVIGDHIIDLTKLLEPIDLAQVHKPPVYLEALKERIKSTVPKRPAYAWLKDLKEEGFSVVIASEDITPPKQFTPEDEDQSTSRHRQLLILDKEEKVIAVNLRYRTRCGGIQRSVTEHRPTLLHVS
jgi:hypothetical protein